MKADTVMEGYDLKDLTMEDFQTTVDQVLTRNKSLLDIMSKCQQSLAGVERTVIKAVTNCGCVQIEGKRQVVPETASLSEMKDYMDNQVRGELCPRCRELLDREMGKNLFYLTALCNTLNIDIYEVLTNEKERLNTLGKYSLR